MKAKLLIIDDDVAGCDAIAKRSTTVTEENKRLRDEVAEHFVGRYAAQAKKATSGIAPAAAAKLLAYTWPGTLYRKLKIYGIE
jgi:hypothetical protein